MTDEATPVVPAAPVPAAPEAAVEVAPAPLPTTKEIQLRAPFEGWKAIMQVRRVPARVLIDLQSPIFDKQLGTVAKLVKSHNFTDPETGEHYADVLDAPIEALTQLMELWGEAVSSIPPM
jgi:hypothetical protein